MYFSDRPCFLYSFFFNLSSFFNSKFIHGLSCWVTLYDFCGKISSSFFPNNSCNLRTWAVGDVLSGTATQSSDNIHWPNSLIKRKRKERRKKVFFNNGQLCLRTPPQVAHVCRLDQLFLNRNFICFYLSRDTCCLSL